MSNGIFTRKRLINKIDDLEDAIPALLRPTLAEIKYCGNANLVTSSGLSTSSDSNDGLSVPNRKRTLQAAHDICVANQGEVVLVGAGHAEDIAGAAAMTFSTAGVTFRGCGSGNQRPVLTWKTSTAAQIIITGAGTTFENFIFDFTGIDAVVAAFLIDAADVTFRNCTFITNSATAGVVSGMTVGTTTTSPRLRIEDCDFRGPATNSGTTTTAQITITDAPDFVIRRNYFTGKMTQSITNGAANLRGRIHDNQFVIATGTKAINMHASSTPFCTNNRINVPSGTAPIVSAAGFMAGNVYSAAAGVTAGTASTF